MSFFDSFVVMLASTVNSLLFFVLGFAVAWWLWWRRRMVVRLDRKWYIVRRVDATRMKKEAELREV
jgi:hypothetical protein